MRAVLERPRSAAASLGGTLGVSVETDEVRRPLLTPLAPSHPPESSPPYPCAPALPTLPTLGGGRWLTPQLPHFFQEGKAVEEFLLTLEEHRRGCEEQGKYVEADLTAKRIEKLKMQEGGRRIEALRAQHISERLVIEEAHTQEFEAFNGGWDTRMGEFSAHSRNLTAAMAERHEEELGQYKKLVSSTRVRFSKELLNLRAIQSSLAKQKDYTGAQKVKVKADQLEAKELEIHRLKERAQTSLSEGKLVQRQQKEMHALQQRVKASGDDHQRRRREELKRLLLRYNNAKQALSKHHKLEVQRVRQHLRALFGSGAA